MRIAIPAGSFPNAQHPAAVCAGDTETPQRAANTVLRAFAELASVRIPAASQRTMNLVSAGGEGLVRTLRVIDHEARVSFSSGPAAPRALWPARRRAGPQPRLAAAGPRARAGVQDLVSVGAGEAVVVETPGGAAGARRRTRAEVARHRLGPTASTTMATARHAVGP